MFYFSTSVAAQSWIEDFDKICAQAEIADSLSTEKLKELSVESDKLLEVIEAGNDPKKKLYIFRLRKCRNFFIYVMDLRGSKKQNPEPDGK
jgi:hypothetical protein